KPREYRHADKVFKREIPAADFPEQELLLLVDLIPGGSVVLDVGANTGLDCYSLKTYGNHLSIFAFEPIPILYRRLKRLLPDLHLFPYALSDKSGIANFKIPYLKSVLFHSRGSLNTDYVDVDETRKTNIEVQTITLDEFVLKNEIRQLDFIKIDVE